MIEFTVGRESGTEMPRLAIVKDGKTVYFGTPGSVPKGVSRLHCKVIVDDDASITIENLTENNLMYVNGVDSKRRQNLSVSDVVELGSCRYKLELGAIVNAISSNQEYSIGHLKALYDAFDKHRVEYGEKKGKLSALSYLPMILSATSGILMAIYNSITIRVVFGVILALSFASLGVIRWFIDVKNPKQLKREEEIFREKYICPNPSCHRFFGMTPYKELKKMHSCPYCRAKFEE